MSVKEFRPSLIIAASKGDLRPYSQHFIFFVTYEWAQLAMSLHSNRMERLANDKHSSFLGVIKVILRRNKLEHFGVAVKDFRPSLIIANSKGDLGPYTQHFIFFVTYE